MGAPIETSHPVFPICNSSQRLSPDTPNALPIGASQGITTIHPPGPSPLALFADVVTEPIHELVLTGINSGGVGKLPANQSIAKVKKQSHVCPVALFTFGPTKNINVSHGAPLWGPKIVVVPAAPWAKHPSSVRKNKITTYNTFTTSFINLLIIN